MSKLTHEKLLESKHNFDLDMEVIFALMGVLHNGGLSESAVTDIADKLESYVIATRDMYKDLWRYVDETAPSEKGEK
jgi:hypothetical protein